MFKNIIITCFLGLSAVILGAFGAHALKEILTAEQLLSFETAVRYQMYHAIVLLFVNIFEGFSAKQKNVISILFFMGVLFFSGSIYLIQLTSITAKSIWFVTPLGGFFFIIGWVSMMVIFIKKYFNK
ncbi:DUF423 domain-containing protein [Polaribacter sp. Hel1_33_49]|jgi:uncharacterized membrane protein YgdD (TMEM256/DUF423 family)|uniref:DUF423 domain-containing protein n=1 Tax=Polaribacter sp. Hel1_33_49 TaxID=1336803 RepID=UPI00052E3E45|nr:DUF423 domain-containing protein [Polaribacter sp. Hel1_33_49]KGL59575.1 conserved hypothetical membrane protein [Polaribacter sp. Hel1_33_49]